MGFFGCVGVLTAKVGYNFGVVGGHWFLGGIVDGIVL